MTPAVKKKVAPLIKDFLLASAPAPCPDAQGPEASGGVDTVRNTVSHTVSHAVSHSVVSHGGGGGGTAATASAEKRKRAAPTGTEYSLNVPKECVKTTPDSGCEIMSEGMRLR
jgi:hypothetical protein